MSTKALSLAAIALIASLSMAKAQVFTNGAVIDDSSIQNVGTVVYAYNFDGGAASTTVNSVTFTGINPLVTPSIDFTLTNPGSMDGTGGGNLPDGTDSNYSSALQVLNENGVGNNFTLQLNGLTSGHEYSVQFVFDANQKDARNQSLVDGAVTSNTITAGGDQGYPVQNPNPNPTGAQYITDTFTATGTSETVVAQYGGGAGAQLSGFALEAVPEPSTLALMGLGLVGLVAFGRRALVRA